MSKVLFHTFLAFIIATGHCAEPPGDVPLANSIFATPSGNLKIVDDGEPTGAILYIQQIDPGQMTIGTIRFMGKNSEGQDTIYAEIYGAIERNEAGNEVGALYFVVQQDGEDSIPLKIVGDEVFGAR